MNSAKDIRRLITTTEATEYLGISTKTMARLIREGVLKTYPHPLDRRKKLVRFQDLARLKAAVERIAA